jgi:hypothetical protein
MIYTCKVKVIYKLLLNNENILNKKWIDCYIEKIINNKVYMGDWEQYKSIKNKNLNLLYMNVV